MPHLGVLVDAPLRFQAAVHPLDVLLGEEGDLLVAQLRLDVVFDVATVALEGTGPHRTRLVLREPAIQPLAQRHPAVLGQLHITVALDVLVQLIQQSFLGLGIHMTEQRLAVFPVADDDAALPASVVTPSHHAVTGRSSFCHSEKKNLRFGGLSVRLVADGVCVFRSAACRRTVAAVRRLSFGMRLLRRFFPTF